MEVMIHWKTSRVATGGILLFDMPTPGNTSYIAAFITFSGQHSYLELAFSWLLRWVKVFGSDIVRASLESMSLVLCSGPF